MTARERNVCLVLCHIGLWMWIPLTYFGYWFAWLPIAVIVAPTGFWVIDRRYKSELKEIAERHAVRMKEIDEKYARRPPDLYALPPIRRRDDERPN